MVAVTAASLGQISGAEEAETRATLLGVHLAVSCGVQMLELENDGSNLVARLVHPVDDLSPLGFS